MERHHLDRAIRFAADKEAAKAIIRKHGGNTRPDSVPEEHIDAATAEIRALGSEPASSSPRPQSVADLDAVAIYAKWNRLPQASK